MLNRFKSIQVASSLDRDNIGLGLQAMTGLPTVLMPGSEPIDNSRYGRAPQVSFDLHFFQTALTHFLQADSEDSFAPSNTFLDFEGMGPHSSEPIAGSSAFAYGHAPQVSFHLHFFQTILMIFYRLRILLPRQTHSWILKVWDPTAPSPSPAAVLHTPLRSLFIFIFFFKWR
jgi:hypothetical protein